MELKIGTDNKYLRYYKQTEFHQNLRGPYNSSVIGHGMAPNERLKTWLRIKNSGKAFDKWYFCNSNTYTQRVMQVTNQMISWRVKKNRCYFDKPDYTVENARKDACRLEEGFDLPGKQYKIKVKHPEQLRTCTTQQDRSGGSTQTMKSSYLECPILSQQPSQRSIHKDHFY